MSYRYGALGQKAEERKNCDKYSILEEESANIKNAINIVY